MLSIGVVYCGNPSHIQRIVEWLESTSSVGFEFLFAYNQPLDEPTKSLFQPFEHRMRWMIETGKSKDQLHNQMIYEAKNPYILFYHHHVQMTADDLIAMVDQIDRLSADVVFTKLNDDALPWYKKRRDMDSFIGVKTVFEDSSILIHLTDTLSGKMFRVEFLRKHRIYFTDVQSLYHIPLMITVAMKRAKFTYYHQSSSLLEEDVLEDYDIFNSLDKVALISKKHHVDDVFDAELNYIFLREIAIEWIQSYKDAPKQDHTQLLARAKAFVKRRNVRFESKYLQNDPRWVKLYLSYSKMILK